MSIKRVSVLYREDERDESIAGSFSPKKTVEVVVVLFSFWTIYCNVLSLLSVSFQTLSRFVFVPLLLSSFFFYQLDFFKKIEIVGQIPVKRWQWPLRIPGGVKWGMALFIPFMFFVTKSLVVFWILSVGYLLIVSLDTQLCHSDGGQYGFSKRQQLVGALLITLLAVLVTLVAHRPDADDASYLNFIVSALDFPDRAFLKYDDIHGIENIPINTLPYRLHSYEMFVALLAKVSGLRPVFLYHVIVPSLSAVLVVFANWLVLDKLFPGKYLLGLIFTFFIYLFWGDSHRVFSNFALVRLFQGKSVLISAIIPLVYFYAVEFVQRRSLHSWLMLFLVQIAALGFSSSALVVAPLASGFVMLGSWRPTINWIKLAMLGVGASVYIIVVGLVITPGFRAFPGIDIRTVLPDYYYTISGLQMVTGDGWMMYFALFSLLVCANSQGIGNRQRLVAGIVFFAVLLTFSPWTSDLIGKKIAGNMSWRIFWALPFPLIMGGAAIHIFNIRWDMKRIRIGPALYVAAIVFCAMASKEWAIAEVNNTTLSTPTLKVDQYYDVARVIKRLTPDKGMVLAPAEVAKWVPTFRGFPYVIVSRPMYLLKLERFVGGEERQSRLKMQNCIEGKPDAAFYLPQLFEEIKRRGIDTVVFRKDNPFADQLVSGVRGMKFHNSPFEMYDIWISSNNTVEEVGKHQE